MMKRFGVDKRHRPVKSYKVYFDPRTGTERYLDRLNRDFILMAERARLAEKEKNDQDEKKA